MINKEQLEAVGKLTALATLMFSAFTYWNNIHIDTSIRKYNFSVDILKEYTDSIRAKEHALENRRAYYGNLNDSNKFPDEYFKAIADEILLDYVETRTNKELQHKKPHLKTLLAINDFYERSYFCATKDICSRYIVTEYICPKALNFYERYKRLLAYYDKTWGRISLPNQEHEFIHLYCKNQ